MPRKTDNADKADDKEYQSIGPEETEDIKVALGMTAEEIMGGTAMPPLGISDAQDIEGNDPDEEERALAVPQRGVERFQRSMENDNLLPLDYYLKLGQLQTPEVFAKAREAGTFWIDDHPSAESIVLVPLGYQAKRTYWKPRGKEVLCRSYNGVTGTGEPGGFCAECPIGNLMWPQKPLCTEGRLFQCYSPEWDKIVLWEVKGAAFRIARQIKTWEGNAGGFGKFAMLLTPGEPIQGDQGIYWTAQCTLVPLDFEVPLRMLGAAGEEDEMPF